MQEPVLFSSTLRFNLDPGGRHTDDQIRRALELAGLPDIAAAPGALDQVHRPETVVYLQRSGGHFLLSDQDFSLNFWFKKWKIEAYRKYAKGCQRWPNLLFLHQETSFRLELSELANSVIRRCRNGERTSQLDSDSCCAWAALCCAPPSCCCWMRQQLLWTWRLISWYRGPSGELFFFKLLLLLETLAVRRTIRWALFLQAASAAGRGHSWWRH